MADSQEQKDQRQTLPKKLALKEEAYYSNCSMVETTPFDIAVLFGKVRPMTDQAGQSSLVEVYERQVYLSHLQAKALHEALGRSLASLSRQGQPQPEQRAKGQTTPTQ
ncbi:MAG: DUF3467 domain-containing protein [Desulfomonilaceae bacterium]|nr:DUF3467 domain-containing protein [Desulfomonilaceae bacterium]